MSKKPAHELPGMERHFLLDFSVVAVIAVAEMDMIIFKLDEPIVRNGDSVRVVAQVVEDLLGAGKGPLRIDDPRFSAACLEQILKSTRVLGILEAAWDTASSVRISSSRERYLPSNTFERHLRGEQVIFRRAGPSCV